MKMKSADGYSLQRICRPQEEQGWKFRGSLGKVVGKDKGGWKAVKRWIWGQELQGGGLKGISGCRNSESVLATVVNTSNPCLLGNTHIILGVWPGKVKGYETVFRWLHLNLRGQREFKISVFIIAGSPAEGWFKAYGQLKRSVHHQVCTMLWRAQAAPCPQSLSPCILAL